MGKRGGGCKGRGRECMAMTEREVCEVLVVVVGESGTSPKPQREGGEGEGSAFAYERSQSVRREEVPNHGPHKGRGEGMARARRAQGARWLGGRHLGIATGGARGCHGRGRDAQCTHTWNKKEGRREPRADGSRRRVRPLETAKNKHQVHAYTGHWRPWEGRGKEAMAVWEVGIASKCTWVGRAPPWAYIRRSLAPHNFGSRMGPRSGIPQGAKRRFQRFSDHLNMTEETPHTHPRDTDRVLAQQGPALSRSLASYRSPFHSPVQALPPRPPRGRVVSSSSSSSSC